MDLIYIYIDKTEEKKKYFKKNNEMKWKKITFCAFKSGKFI